MALSGRYEWKYNYGYGMVVFEWTATQNTAANTSTVKWELFGEPNPDCVYNTPTDSQGRPNYFEDFFYVKANSTFSVNGAVVYTEKGLGTLGYQLWYFEDQHYSDGSSTLKVKASGTTTITHNADGTGTFTANFNGNISSTGPVYGWEPFNTTTTFTLDKIDRNSSVTATSGYIGEDITINITRINTSFTHTLTYTFGSLSGTITTKTTSTNIKWTLPTSFYNEIGNNKSKTGTITCQAFSGSTSIGTSTTQFTASVNPATSAPVLSPTVVDVNSTTIALTGSANKLIRYESRVQFAVNATAQNGATIVSQFVTCGTMTVNNTANGYIDAVESGEFVFVAVDSRGLRTEKTITKEIINYIKPTCYLKLAAELTGVTGATISATISGSYYNGSLGTTSNTFALELRHTNDSGAWGGWQQIHNVVSPTFSNNTYTLDIEFGGFGYSSAYEFQARLTDKLNTINSTIYTIQVLPVFDWSKDDFNFNVPVNINGDLELTGIIRVNGVNIISALQNAGII